MRALVLALLATGCATTSAGPALTPREEAAVKLSNGRAAEAVPILERLFAQSPKDLSLARSLCEAHVKAGSAEAYARKLEAQDTAIAWYQRGLLGFARASQASQPAIDAFERAIALEPQEPEFQHRLGIALLESERDEAALVHLKRAAADPKAPTGWSLPLAKALHRTGDAASAVKALRTLLSGAPSPTEVATARRLMDELADPFARFPAAARGQLEQGITLLQVNDQPQQAVILFEEILHDYPDLGVVHALLGLAYQRLDDAGRAVDELKRAIELSPDEGKNYAYLGDLYLTRQRVPAARELYEKALERNPLLDDGWLHLGDLAFEQKDLQRALECYRVLALLQPQSPAALGKLALVYQLQEDWPAAERQLKRVTDADPENVEFMLRLGALNAERYRRSKKTTERAAAAKEARAWLEKVLDKQPENAIASRALESLGAP